MSNLKEFKCPECGSTKVVYHEEVTTYRHVRGVNADDEVVIESYCREYDGEPGENHRFYCADCQHEWPVGTDDMLEFI